MGDICSKLTTKITKQSQWRRSAVFIVNIELIAHTVMVSIVDFKQVNAG